MLKGKNVILRLFTEDDLKEFSALDADVVARGEYYPIGLRPDAVLHRRFNDTGLWDKDVGHMLITTHEGRMIGTVFFFQSTPYRAGYEVGYWILRPQERGKGYMTEALRIFSAYLFEVKEIPRLELGILPGNDASRRVAEKCGFKLDGVMRKQYFCHGRYHDLQVWSLLREESPTLADALAG